MQKNISLILTANCLESSNHMVYPTVVIYDILRATSTITTALAHGAKVIIPVLAPKDALNIHAQLKKQKCNALLGGERNGELIEGFHLGNSPMEYTKARVRDQTIIFTTTNGTRAMLNSRKAGAKKIYIASLLNQKTIVKSLQHEQAITLICAGVKGRFAFEDFYAAGLMLHELTKHNPGWNLDDPALAALGLARGFQCNPEPITWSHNGQRLKNKKKTADVKFCSTANRFPVLPVLLKDRIELVPPLPVYNS